MTLEEFNALKIGDKVFVCGAMHRAVFGVSCAEEWIHLTVDNIRPDLIVFRNNQKRSWMVFGSSSSTRASVFILDQ